MKRLHSDSEVNPLILDEASEWFVDFRVGDVDAAGREAFNAWLCRSPEHIRAYMQIGQAYADLPALKDETPFDPEELGARARSEGNVVPLDAHPSLKQVPFNRLSKASTPRRSLSAFAAATILTILGGTAYWGFDAYRSPSYKTATGEQHSVTLDDGSTVALNAQSRVRIRFSKQERRVDLLAGQALFDVAKDKSRPFVVHSQDTIIRAIGTQFDVYQRKKGTTVTVLEGRVAVVSASSGPPSRQLPVNAVPTRHMTSSARAQNGSTSSARAGPVEGEVHLSAGEQVVVTPGAALAPRKSKPSIATAWIQRQLIFEFTSLPDVAEEFNRYSTRALVVRDGRLDDFRISGVYSSNDPASLVRFLEAQPGLIIEEHENQILVRQE
jgi:transmembrane sensor